MGPLACSQSLHPRSSRPSRRRVPEEQGEQKKIRCHQQEKIVLEAVFGPDMNRLQNGAVAAEAEVWGTACMLGPESSRFMRRRELDILGNVVLKVEEVQPKCCSGSPRPHAGCAFLQHSLFVERNHLIADQKRGFLFQKQVLSVEKPRGIQDFMKTGPPLASNFPEANRGLVSREIGHSGAWGPGGHSDS